MADKAFSWKEFFLADIPAAIAASIGVPALLGALKKEFGATGEAVVAKPVYDKFFVNKTRAKLMVLIHDLAKTNPSASENLFKRQEDRQFLKARIYGDNAPYEPGDEDFMVAMLGKIFLAFDDDKEKKIEVFTWLGTISDEDFDSTLEFVHHDAFLQFLRKGWGYIKAVWREFYRADQNNPGVFQKIDRTVAGQLQKALGWMNERGIR